MNLQRVSSKEVLPVDFCKSFPVVSRGLSLATRSLVLVSGRLLRSLEDFASQGMSGGAMSSVMQSSQLRDREWSASEGHSPTQTSSIDPRWE